MKIFLTGPDGLLGSNVARELISAGHSVKAFLLPGISAPTLEGLDLEKAEGDLLDENFNLARAMAGCDAVIHCAAITDLWADPKLTWKVNLEGTRRILDGSLAAKIKRLIFVGSASSYQPGTLEKPGNETGGFPAVYHGEAYMESKYQASELARKYVRERGLDAVIVTPTFMIGPYDSRPSGGEMVRQFLEKGMRVSTRGGRNFAYVRDVAGAMVNALDRGKTGESYILGGENLSYLEFFGRIAKIAGRKAPNILLPDPLVLLAGSASSLVQRITGKKMVFNRRIARYSLLSTFYSSAKAEKELGLKHSPIDLALEESIGALRKYGHLNLDQTGFFKDKAVLITGGSRGVGFATARELSLRGAKVVISARGAKRLLDSRDRLERMGAEVAAVAGDVGKWEDAEKMVNAALEKFGRLDILINNAGVSMRGNFSELAPEVIEQVSRTNLIGCLYPTRAAINHIIKNQGHIVFISSIAGLFGLPGASVYCATKKALTGLAESMRLELIPKGVHIGVVYLGFTEHDPEKRIIAADNQLVPPDRPAHHTQAFAADLIVGMLQKRTRQLIMTPIGTLGWLIYRLSPAMVEKAILWAQSSQWAVFKRFS